MQTEREEGKKKKKIQGASRVTNNWHKRRKRDKKEWNIKKHVKNAKKKRERKCRERTE